MTGRRPERGRSAGVGVQRRSAAGGLPRLHRGHDPTRSTEFSAGVTAACQVMDESDDANRLVVFLSDGRNRSGEPLASVLPCDAATVFQTLPPERRPLRAGERAGRPAGDRRPDRWPVHHGGGPVAAAVDPGVGGLAPDPAHPARAGWRDPIDISREASPQPPEAGRATIDVDYPISALPPGEHEICMTVFASDAGGTGVVSPARRWTPPEDGSPPTSRRPQSRRLHPTSGPRTIVSSCPAQNPLTGVIAPV